MDDRTAPSVVVRHNVQGLSAVFPPAYLLSFTTNEGDEPLHDAPDLPLYFRSRMTGVAWSVLPDRRVRSNATSRTCSVRSASTRYVRDTLSEGTHRLLTPQAAVRGGPAWDALQTTVSDTRPVVLWAFQSDPSVGEFTVKPVGLRARTVYEVVSADRGRIGFATGDDLMINGIVLRQSPISGAHVLVLRPAWR